jgi:SPP1 gp7 family putative phage head morphogenesis protein
MFMIETTVRVAQAAGRWSRLQANKRYAPYLMYVSRMDGRERPEHHAWHGTILHIDDPWWQTHYPPCGWNCRCRVLAFSAAELKARGLKVTEPSNIIRFPVKPYLNPRTGELIPIEQGIDPGWNHNVGASPLRGLSPRAPVSGGVSASEVEGAAKSLLRPFKAEAGRVIKDKDGWPIAFGPEMFKDAEGRPALPRPDLIDRMPDVARALAKPDRAEWVWREGGGGVPADPAQIPAFVTRAQTERSTTEVLRVGTVAPWLNELARGQGVDVFDFAHTIDGSAVRHILTRHGNAVKEAAQGQIAVSASDFSLIPDIFARPDVVVFGLQDKGAQPLMAFIKDAGPNAGTWVYLAERRARRWALTAKTLWRVSGNFSAADDATDIIRSLDLYAQNDSGATAKIVDMRGKINATASEDAPRTRVSLIRRYTKRLDNALITIDFARDTWTFDIQPAA